jgi:hypothetical protein
VTDNTRRFNLREGLTARTTSCRRASPARPADSGKRLTLEQMDRMRMNTMRKEVGQGRPALESDRLFSPPVGEALSSATGGKTHQIVFIQIMSD